MSIDGRFVEQARRDLAALLAAHPEIAEDDVLHIDMVTAETNAMELLDKLVEAEKSAATLAQCLDVIMAQLSKRRERFTHRRALVRKYMMQILEAAGLRKAERPAATVSISAGRQKVVITDENALPDDCVRIKREADKTRIATQLHRGDYVPGASLSNSEPVLRIS